MSDRDTRLRSYLTTGLRYGLGLGILWWVVQQADWSGVGRLLGLATVPTLLLVIVASVIGLLARFYTWKAFLSSVGRVSLGDAARVDLTTNFVNQLLPSRVSGRAVSPLVITRLTDMTFGEAVGVSGMHTGMFALVYGVIALGGVTATADRISTPVLLLIATTTAIYLLLGSIILIAGTRLETFESVLNCGMDLLGRVPLIGGRMRALGQKVPQFTAESSETFRKVSGDQAALAEFTGAWVIALPLTATVRVGILFAMLGVTWPSPIVLPFVIVAAYSVTLLPLTPGGIGVTETTATLVFVSLGIPASVAAPVVLVDRVFGVYLPAILGWYPSIQLDIRDTFKD